MSWPRSLACLAVCLALLTSCTWPVATLLRFKAEAENKKGDFKAAIADCDRAIILAPSLVGAHYERGLARFNLNDFDGAIRDFEAEIKHSKIAAFLPGKVSEADFLAAAKSPDTDTTRTQHCQAWCYAGMRRLLSGDKIAAID